MQLRNAGEDLRRRFSDLASRSYRHDYLDASTDRMRSALLEGPVAVLDALQAVSILAPGPLGQLRSELAELRPLFEIDEQVLRNSVILPGKNPPRPIDGASADARFEVCERRAHQLVASWTDTLFDSLNEPEMGEQIRYLADGDAKAQVQAIATTRVLPDPISTVFVAGLNQVFTRVDIRQLASNELVGALFPDTSPATAEQLRDRLDALLVAAIDGAKPEQVRFLPASEV